MTEQERRQHTDELKKQVIARQQAEAIRSRLAGLERERATFNAAGRVEALQREILSILQRDERLTLGIEAARQQLAQLGFVLVQQ